MPKAGKIIDNQQKVIPKTERMIYLPRSYNIRDKTERMVDLPSIINNYEEPRLITSNLIYFLDGAGYTIRNNEWYDSITKNSVSKASIYDLGGGLISPTVEDRSFKLTIFTNPLVTSLSSDDFSNLTGFYTISVYIKINAVVASSRRILTILNNPILGGGIYLSIFQISNTPAISFRSSTSLTYRSKIEYGKSYMLTIVKNNNNFIYYVNDRSLLTESTSVVIPRSVSNTAPIVLGNVTTSQPNASYYGFLVYNRVLTVSEIAHNYEHLKARYGSTTSNSAYNIPSVLP